MMNQNPQFHVVLDIDGTTPPIKVVSGSDGEYIDAIKGRCKKTADFRKDFRKRDSKLGVKDAIKKQISSTCSCDKECQRKFWQKRFPVWRIMRKYQWRKDILSDLVSGLTVGIMQLPQGMAYALLAELPPVVGLYMAFFPVLIYFLLGSSKHISMGTVALCSLLTGSVISRFYDPSLAKVVMGDSLVTRSNDTSLPESEPLKFELPDDAKISIASSVGLLVGIMQLGMGFFNMGFITTYMSDPMLGGFTTGAAVHVGTSQVKYALGLKIPRSDGVFQIIKTYTLIFKSIAETNIPTLITSLICMTILYCIKVHINQRFKDRLKFPVPVELIVVVGSTLASHYLNFSSKFKILTVGKIPAGLPEPTIPPLPVTSVYITDALIIAVVAFSQCVGLAAIFAKKHSYTFDPNQELIAYGAGNVFGSFFSCYPYAASVSRSSVQESAGGKTQLASVFSAILVLIVILSIGPLFESLPNCALASIILVALRSLFLQMLELPKLWRTSAYDCLIWVVTFLSTVILHVDYGIMIGMLFSFFTIVLRSQRTKAQNLEKIGEIQQFENSSQYRTTESLVGIKVIRFPSALYYANGKSFVKQVYTLTGVIPEKLLKQMRKMGKMPVTSTTSVLPLVNESNEMGSEMSLDIYAKEASRTVSAWNGMKTDSNPQPKIYNNNTVHNIIIDCSGITFIDTVGAKVLKQLVYDYGSVKVRVSLCAVNDEVWRVLKMTDVLASYEDRIYLTLDDAINAINIEEKLQSVSDVKLVPTTSRPEIYRPLSRLASRRSNTSVMSTNEDCVCRRTADFREEFRRSNLEESKGPCSSCRCSKKNAINFASKLVPSYRYLKKYNIRTDLVADIICGLTVGIMQLPQGMAYAMLAELPPVVGLYMSFFPVLVYVIFGSSKHISMGTVAVVSLLTGSVVARFYEKTGPIPDADLLNITMPNDTNGNVLDSDDTAQLPVDTKLGIAMTVAMLVGFTQVGMGLLRLGFVTTYMSDPLISGFTTGTAVHVGTSQVKYIFGLKIPRTDGLFQVVKTYIRIFENIGQTNITTLIISIICIIIIYLVKVQINQRFKDKLKIPVPIELLVVIAGTLASYFGKFHESFKVKIVGSLPAGMPSPTGPSFEGVDKYISDIPIIAVISFAQSVSLASIMAKKHKYAIDPNQELIAYGLGNLFGSFFHCYPYAASVSRSSVQESAGGKTQFANIFSAALVLVVIIWLGPLFEHLPNCVLSAIIVVALRSLILQVLELPKIWRTSKYDFMIWVVTCSCATLLHVDYGLLIGLVFSFFSVVLRTQSAKPRALGKIRDGNVYKDPKVYHKTYENKDIKVIGFSYPLYFANGDLFVREVYRLSTVKPEKLRKQIRRASQLSQGSRNSSFTSVTRVNSDASIVHMQDRKASTTTLDEANEKTLNGTVLPFHFDYPITHIVLDFSSIPFVDTVGCKVLKQLLQDYANVNIKVYFCDVSDDIWDVFEATEILPKYKDCIYLTLDDAINAANEDNTTKKAENGNDKISYM